MFKLEVDKGLESFYQLNPMARNSEIHLMDNEFLCDHYSKIKQKILSNRFNIITADTGLGKTHFAKKLFLEDEYNNIVFIAPLEAIVQEISYDLRDNHNFTLSNRMEELGLIELKNNKKTVIVCTYHHFLTGIEQLQQPDLLLIDEVHWLHTYSFADNLTAKMLLAIKQLRNKATIIGFTATFQLLEQARHWFFIEKFIYIKTINPKLPPKKVILYTGNGEIKNSDFLKHYLYNYVDWENEKIMIVIDGGNKKNPSFSNYEKSVESLLGEDINIVWQKAQDKMKNEDVQFLLSFQKLPKETKGIAATIWISNGINIIDENIKHIFVLSDRGSIVQQTAARIRIPNYINLVFCQQFRQMEVPPCWNEMDNYLKSRVKGKVDLKFKEYNKIPTWVDVSGYSVWNPIKVLEKWYENIEKYVFLKNETIKDMIEKLYGEVDIDVVGEHLIKQTLTKDEIKKERKNLGFDFIDKKRLPDHTFAKNFEIKTPQQKEHKLYTKSELKRELIKKQIPWNNDTVGEVYKNRRKMYYKKE